MPITQPPWEALEEGVADMTCPTCRSSALVEIGLNLRDQQVTMRSCSACEHRWWDSAGQPLSLPSVLKLVAAK